MSAARYLAAGHVLFSDAAPFIIPSVFGALLGTFLLQKINGNILKKIFSLFMIYAGVRLILR